MNPRLRIAILATAASLALSSTALADTTGTVSGRLTFYQNQGNYCPTTRDCTGSVYTQSQFNTYTGLAYGKVYLRDAAGIIKGQGTTDVNGNFTMTWVHLGTGAPPQMRVLFNMDEKDGRFKVRNGTGVAFDMTSAYFTVTPNTNKPIGTVNWGSPGSPNAAVNVYDGAKRMWYDSLTYAGRMGSYFTNVEIRAFNSVCSTSCANGPTKLINLDPAAMYKPQARVMHEMGHIASYLSHNGQSYGQNLNYNYNGSGGWVINSAEFGSAQFEEAMATFFGDRAIYWNNAIAPHTCNSTGACTANQFNTETSTGSTCAVDENRQPLTVMRYLEDLYDTNVDYTGENVAAPYYYFFEVLASYPEGTANYAEDEAAAGCPTNCDNDGRSGNDFYWRWWWKWSIATTTQYTNNCSMVGD